MVHPVPRKLSSHPCELHAIFFNGLKFRVESMHFHKKLTRLWKKSN
jgi:hypothetical protein